MPDQKMPDEPQAPDWGQPLNDVLGDEKDAALDEASLGEHDARRLNELAAHPHVQLRSLLADLRAPAATAGDITTKHAHLHAAVVRLTQLVLQHTPAPEEDDGQERIIG